MEASTTTVLDPGGRVEAHRLPRVRWRSRVTIPAALQPLGVMAFVAGAVLVSAAVVARLTDRPLGFFTRDPVAASATPPYVGMVSTLGILCWWTTAVCLAIAAWHAHLGNRRSHRLAFAVAAVAVAYLALDDAFQVHEWLLPRLGIPEEVSQLTYVAAFAAMVFAGRGIVGRNRRSLLLVTGGFLGAALGMDVVLDSLRFVWLEDSLKFAGLVGLAVYAVAALADELRSVGTGQVSLGLAPVERVEAVSDAA